MLISLGPAAKIISLELIKNGFRVLDVGHLDIEYEWFLRNATTKISIPNKYVNENEKHPYIVNNDINKKIYQSQIIYDYRFPGNKNWPFDV
ncbi:GT-D fold domain-containing glycosyltransferase [Sutterella seckii]|uniref:GT-D fold domain-containing glycosyltransferase n=1 Tax=Sutterella seckii TaxID=1944635 RepID=UPI001D05C174